MVLNGLVGKNVYAQSLVCVLGLVGIVGCGSLVAGGHLSWLALLALTWIIGFGLLVGSTYVGVVGVVVCLGLGVAVLFMKTLLLWGSLLGGTSAQLYVVGAYGGVHDGAPLQLAFLLDSYSCAYVVLTLGIGLWVLPFGFNYMRAEPRIAQFLLLLYLFLLSMVVLLAAANLPAIMLGWELIGCFSYLLINFWVTRVGTAKSAFKAMFVNKLSDVSLIFALLVFLIWVPGGSRWGFAEIVLLGGARVECLGLSVSAATLLAVFLLICSFCKSAQFGFHVWLPDSMEAPVPASALIHSATLVSAGVYLLGRAIPANYVPEFAQVVFGWGALTALYGGAVAAYQTDLKKILAYSTISHCGLLMALVATGNVAVLVVYLHLHGWFKSFSFMAAGNIIAHYGGYQDYRRASGIVSLTTRDVLTLAAAITALGGLPFTLGFFNKHYLMLLLGENVHLFGMVCIMAAAFTGLYYSLGTVSGVWGGHVRSGRGLVTLPGVASPSLTLGTGAQISSWGFVGYSTQIALLVGVLLLGVGGFPTGVIAGPSGFGVFFFKVYLVLAGFWYRAVPVVVIVGIGLTQVLYAVVCG